MTSADTASSFCDVFSPLSYDRFMANPSLSENLKAAVTERALSYFNQVQEKKQASKGAAAEAEPLPSITELPLRNDSLAEELFSLDVIEQTITSYGSTRATAIPDELLGTDPAIPDWDELLGAARIEAAEMSSSNALGIADKAYRESYGKWVSSALAGWNLYGSAAERGFRSGEWDDYELLLDVCEELGLEPLVVIAPVKGAAYDATYYDEEARAAFYEDAASVAESYGFPVADLTAYEYDPTFSSNVDDIGWTGWVRLCQSIYDYVVGESE